MADDSEPTRDTPRTRDHLRLVTEPETVEAAVAAAGRPRTIGRLIAQTALIAESTVNRRRDHEAAGHGPRGIGERLLGRFR